jgi:hypothetical protein
MIYYLDVQRISLYDGNFGPARFVVFAYNVPLIGNDGEYQRGEMWASERKERSSVWYVDNGYYISRACALYFYI